jgi:hypothetical protein
MPVAHDEALDLVPVETHQVHVVEQSVGGVAEVEQEVTRVRTDARLEAERQAPLIMQRLAVVGARIGRGTRDLDPLGLGRPRRVVGAVDQHSDRQAVHHRDRARSGEPRLGESRARETERYESGGAGCENELTTAQADLHAQLPLVEDEGILAPPWS